MAKRKRSKKKEPATKVVEATAAPKGKKLMPDPQGRETGWWYGKQKTFTGRKPRAKRPMLGD